MTILRSEFPASILCDHNFSRRPASQGAFFISITCILDYFYLPL